MRPKISVLVAARKNSKYLAKFLLGYFDRTQDFANTEILVMLNEHDTWNNDLVQYFDWHDHVNREHYVKFFRENLELGRAGLHEYFNELYKQATGEWIVYFCEDHFITMPGWDDYLRSLIMGTLRLPGPSDQPVRLKNDQGPLDPNKVWCIIPKFDNAGAMNQILSRGYCEALGGIIGRHGWIDSYVNDLNAAAFGIAADRPNYKEGDRIFKLDDETFHDFTHDKPNPMSDAHMQSITEGKGKQLPKYTDSVVLDRIREDAEKLKQAIGRGL
jgi:hypothetical protein